MHNRDIEYLLSIGSWICVGNILDCEIEGCHNKMSDLIWFTSDIKYCLCSEHLKEYLSKRNYELAKEQGYV